MVGNLDLPQIAEGQDDKELTINLATLKVDLSLTDTVDLDLTSGNHTITLTEWYENIHFRATNATVVGRTVTVQQLKRMILLENDAASTENVDFVVGTGTITLNPGDAVVAYADGTTNGLTQIGSAGTAGIYDFPVYYNGKPGASEVMMKVVCVRAFTLPAGLTLSQGYATTVPTGAVSFGLEKNGSSIGSVDFAASASTATFTFVSAVSFAAGDRLELIAPASQDATLAAISITLAGTR
jgi:hypothetical protein